MQTLTNLAMFGIPVAGMLTLGAIWLTRSVFKEVSLNTAQAGDNAVAKAERRAEGLGFELEIAEDLGVDAGTLNVLKDQVDLAHEDAELARKFREEQATSPATVPVPWLTPIAAVHSTTDSGIKKPGAKHQ